MSSIFKKYLSPFFVIVKSRSAMEDISTEDILCDVENVNCTIEQNITRHTGN